jgi:hypothetical protein
MPQQRVRRVTVIGEASPQQRLDLGKLPKSSAQKLKAQLKAGITIVRVDLGPDEQQEMEDPAP